MGQETPKKPTKSDIVFLLLFGAFQGALVAFVITLSSRHHNGHWESQRHLLIQFGIAVAVFSLGTVAQRKLFPRGIVRPPRTPAGARVQIVLFWALMLGLSYALWKMF
jgi:ABC-type Fe3+-siderophore transport system permease subunit